LPWENDGRLGGVDVLGGIPRGRVVLDEVDGEVSEVGEVEAIEPDHWARPVLAMVVPVPCRREDDIASVHLYAATVHGGEAAVALDDESHGERRVPVGRRRLIGHDELKSGVDGVCREGGIYQIKV
jgi:hypothetical protein